MVTSSIQNDTEKRHPRFFEDLLGAPGNLPTGPFRLHNQDCLIRNGGDRGSLGIERCWRSIDHDEAVLIPAAYLDQVLAEAPEQERLEGWIMDEVLRGAELPGLYPMNEATRARYMAWNGPQG